MQFEIKSHYFIGLLLYTTFEMRVGILKKSLMGMGFFTKQHWEMGSEPPLQDPQKTMGLLPWDWRSWEKYSMLKSRESMLENHWELCRTIKHMVNDYVTLDIDLRLLDNG